MSPLNGCETWVTWEANFYFQGSIVENSRGMGRQELGKDKGAVFPFIGIFLSFHNTVVEDVMWYQPGSVAMTAH